MSPATCAETMGRVYCCAAAILASAAPAGYSRQMQHPPPILSRNRSMLRRTMILCAMTHALICGAARADGCGNLTHMKLGHVAVTSAQTISAGLGVKAP